jgi:hypothetical protein
MPRLKTETFGTGDMTWLGSDHGIFNGRTELLDISAFVEADNYPDGYIPSGTPLAKVGGLMVPYTSAEGTTTNAGVLAGFLLTDQSVNGAEDFAVPVQDHGRVRTAKVPKGTDVFTAPVLAAKRAASNFVFI